MINKIKNWLKNEEGAETMEYVIIAGLVVVVGVTIYNASFGNALTVGMQNLVNAATSAATSSG